MGEARRYPFVITLDDETTRQVPLIITLSNKDISGLFENHFFHPNYIGLFSIQLLPVFLGCVSVLSEKALHAHKFCCACESTIRRCCH